MSAMHLEYAQIVILHAVLGWSYGYILKQDDYQ
jgi:hypothetical protein